MVQVWWGKPEVIKIDNGPEFTSETFDARVRKSYIKLCFKQPEKPTQNRWIERLNGNYRKEVLLAHLFTDLNEVRDQTQKWIWTYNNIRPHQSLGNKPPTLLVKQEVPSLEIDKH